MMELFLNNLLASRHSHPDSVKIVNDNAKMDPNSLARILASGNKNSSLFFRPNPLLHHRHQGSHNSSSDTDEGRDRRDRWRAAKRQSSDSCLAIPQRKFSSQEQKHARPALSSVSDHSVLPARLHHAPQHQQEDQERLQRLRRPRTGQERGMMRWHSAQNEWPFQSPQVRLLNDVDNILSIIDGDTAVLSTTSEHQQQQKKDGGAVPAGATTNGSASSTSVRPTTAGDFAISMPQRCKSPPNFDKRKVQNRLDQLDDSTHLKRMDRLKDYSLTMTRGANLGARPTIPATAEEEEDPSGDNLLIV